MSDPVTRLNAALEGPMGLLPASLLLLQLGCGILGPGNRLEPSELCSDHGDSAIATFEDPVLEAELVVHLQLGGSGDLTCDLVSGLTHLDIGHLDPGAGPIPEDLVSLVGIQNFTSLTNLDLSHNFITDISPLSGLTSLTNLDLSYNSIRDISGLSGLTSLTDLSFYSNVVTDISALSGLTSLTDLNIGGNRINDISPLSGLTSLTNLDLSHNLINDISALSGLTSLTILLLHINSITDISALRGLTSLTILLLFSNPNLSNIQPLLDNTGLGAGDEVAFFDTTSVSCTDVAALEAKGVTVRAVCP